MGTVKAMACLRSIFRLCGIFKLALRCKAVTQCDDTDCRIAWVALSDGQYRSSDRHRADWTVGYRHGVSFGD